MDCTSKPNLTDFANQLNSSVIERVARKVCIRKPGTLKSRSEIGFIGKGQLYSFDQK